MGRGRPAHISKESFLNTILKYADEIFIDNDRQKVVSKTDNVWSDISKQINLVLTSESIYSKVTSNYYGVKEYVKINSNIQQSADHSIQESDLNESLMSSCQSDDSVYEKTYIEFEFTIPAEKFDDLNHIVDYNRTLEGTEKKKRYRRFIPGVYQPYFNYVL